jgi:hypothetical protein
MDTAEATERRPAGHARAFTTVAVDFTAAITLVIPGPFAGPVAHGGVGGMATMRTLPLVGEKLGAGGMCSAISSWQVRVSA